MIDTQMESIVPNFKAILKETFKIGNPNEEPDEEIFERQTYIKMLLQKADRNIKHH